MPKEIELNDIVQYDDVAEQNNTLADGMDGEECTSSGPMSYASTQLFD